MIFWGMRVEDGDEFADAETQDMTTLEVCLTQGEQKKTVRGRMSVNVFADWAESMIDCANLKCGAGSVWDYSSETWGALTAATERKGRKNVLRQQWEDWWCGGYATLICISNLDIDPRCRRKGGATYLVKAIMRLMMHAPTLFVTMCSEDNQASLALFRGLGFRDAGRDRGGIVLVHPGLR